jgi:hypothetical protein
MVYPSRRHTHSSSAGQWQIRYEVRSVVSRQIPDVPAFRCVGCGGTRLLPLTFAGSRRTRRSELPVRPKAKCITCGCRYVGTHVLPAESTLIWLAAYTDANQSAPWGPALAEWSLHLDSESGRLVEREASGGSRSRRPSPRRPAGCPPGCALRTWSARWSLGLSAQPITRVIGDSDSEGDAAPDSPSVVARLTS